MSSSLFEYLKTEQLNQFKLFERFLIEINKRICESEDDIEKMNSNKINSSYTTFFLIIKQKKNMYENILFISKKSYK